MFVSSFATAIIQLCETSETNPRLLSARLSPKITLLVLIKKES